MIRRIAWYVHHHGFGHLGRLLSVAPHLDAEITCFSSLSRPADLPRHCSWTELDRDDDIAPAATDGAPPSHRDPTARGLLHWAPIGHAGHRDRFAAIASSIAESPVQAFVVDVSVEVTLLARLLGIPPVIITQPGLRDDPPHQLGFQAADTIIAPWPEELLAPAHLTALRDRVVYTGGISRFEGREIIQDAPRSGVVLLGGRGGSAVSSSQIADAADASGRSWTVLGAAPDASWSTDPWRELTSAEVVVSWAGQNSIADLAAAGAAAVVIAQQRPFAEQRETAAALQRAGLAVVADEWPDAAAWRDLLERAAVLGPDWSRWQVTGAAERAAEAIEAAAAATR